MFPLRHHFSTTGRGEDQASRGAVSRKHRAHFWLFEVMPCWLRKHLDRGARLDKPRRARLSSRLRLRTHPHIEHRPESRFADEKFAPVRRKAKLSYGARPHAP